MRFFYGMGLGALACLVFLEILLTFLPVNSGIRMANTSNSEPIPRYLPNQPYTYSYGWALANVQKAATNQVGYTNSLNTMQPRGILVTGDSYIESLMLKYPDTVQGRLEAQLPNQVMAIAASANGLADSLQIISAYAPKLQPATLVFFVEPYDMLDLLAAPSPGHSGFVRHDDNVHLVHNAYTESSVKEISLKSALIRYVYYNLKFPKWFAGVFAGKPATAADSTAILQNKTLVLNYYFGQLQQLSAKLNFKVLFLLDGDRAAIYAGQRNAEKAWSNQDDRRLFLELAGQYGLDVIDMEPVFFDHWQKNHERFDWKPMDAHWNPVAHQLAAQEVLRRINHN